MLRLPGQSVTTVTSQEPCHWSDNVIEMSQKAAASQTWPTERAQLWCFLL